ncbi:MAG: hypothetical protein ACOH2T_25745 [Pseudomonas sp.]
MELVDLYLNLEFSLGDDVYRARRLYDQSSHAAIASTASLSQPSEGVETTQEVIPEPLAELERSGLNTTEPKRAEAAGIDTASTGPTISFQITSESPSLEGLYPTPSFDELVERGWIRASWGRFSVPREIVTAVLRDRKAAGTGLKLLIEERDSDVFELRSGYSPNGILRDIADGVVTGQFRLGEIACVSREWIAARLWDARSENMGGLSIEQSLSRWVDRWRFLNWPSFAMSSHVDRASFETFVDTALGVLTAPSTTPGWEEFRCSAGAPRALLYPHQGLTLENVVPALPVSTIERIQWMQHWYPQATFYDYLGNKGSSLLAALMNELTEAMFDPVGLSVRLMDIVTERPVLLQHLSQTAQRVPTLLADMLMAPSTCPLACSIIASWTSNGGGWNREFQAQANRTTELLAFEDALALLGNHIDSGHLQSNELTALYMHVYELTFASRQSTHRDTMLSLLREEIATADNGVQDAVIADLIVLATASPDPMSAFCAALDLISNSSCEERISASEMVSLYLNVVMPKGERLGLRKLAAKSAQSLVALAFRGDDTLRTQFLNAIDVPSWRQSAPTSEQDQYSYQSLLISRIRLHIRVISRAITEWPTNVPNELVETLANAIYAGAMDRPERGRVDAFTHGPGFGSSWTSEERLIALDLADALRRLSGAAAQRVLTQLCQIEEPAVLAGIFANTPPALNEQIKAHLQTLTPEASSEVWSLPALQGRIEALLSAGLPDIAEVFVAVERSAVTLGPVPGRQVSSIRMDLQLLFLRERWHEIATYELPESKSISERQEANDALLFYQGLAELKRLGGNLERTETIFLDLAQRNRGISSYHTNLFASRVQRLLNDDAFRLLSGNALHQARHYLVESLRVTRPLIQHSALDLKALDLNRVMLLLAANQPGECLQILLELRESNFEENIEGFRALALARIGSKREALSVLLQAEGTFGQSNFLSAVRENIDAHRPYTTAPNLALGDDPVPGIRHAFDAFSRLGHVEQAEVLQSHGRFDLYLIDEVRGACASLVAVAPMMRGLGMMGIEDDISGILKQLLRSRLLLQKWAVEDQSRGGFSGSGGVGERDIVVSNGSATLMVIEALTTDYVATGNLTSHFNKLLGYDTCRFFFHITYARRINCGAILNHLKTACVTPPSGINYVRLESLDDFDSMPVGFRAHYEIDGRNASVVFLALEIGQPIQRAAAAMR